MKVFPIPPPIQERMYETLLTSPPDKLFHWHLVGGEEISFKVCQVHHQQGDQ